MIVVATADFEVYHELVTELRARGVRFTTIEPGDDLPGETQVVLTAPDDDPVVPADASPNPDSAVDADPDPDSNSDADPGPDSGSTSTSAEGADSETDPNDGSGADDPHDDADIEVVVAEPGASRRATDEALATLRGTGGRTIVGVDPGDRPGIAVRSGGVVVAAFQVPLTEAASVIEREAAKASDAIVRIGDGARLKGASIVDDLDDVTTELVDETGTTPHLGSGARGMGDVLAAVNIARLPGDRVSEREIDPTPGEIETIKRRSRERSNGDRTIDETLARRVARGELTVDEALDEHRNG